MNFTKTILLIALGIACASATMNASEKTTKKSGKESKTQKNRQPEKKSGDSVQKLRVSKDKIGVTTDKSSVNGVDGPKKIKIFCGFNLGGNYTPAAAVSSVLEEKLKSQSRYTVELQASDIKHDYYYGDKKGLRSEDGLKHNALHQRRAEKIAAWISYLNLFTNVYDGYILYNKTIGRLYQSDFFRALEAIEKMAYDQADDQFSHTLMYMSTYPLVHNSLASRSVQAKNQRIIIACMPCDVDDMFDGVYIYNPHVLYFLYSKAQIARAQRFGCKYIKISGLPLRPEFRDIRQTPKAEMKKKLGFNPDESLTLVFFGAAGSHRARKIAQILKNENAVIICGHDTALKEELEKIGNNKHRILGFVSAREVAEYLRASDCVAGKTGGAQTFESIECETVFLFAKDEYSLPLEDGNGKFLMENGVGRELKSWDKLPAAIAEVVKNKADYQKRFAGLKNNGAEEVAIAVKDILKNYRTWQDELWGPSIKAEAS